MTQIIKPDEYKPEDNDFGPLSQRQAENLADFASSRAEQRMYANLGRSVVRKVIYLLGAACAVAGSWLMDWIHFGPK